MWTCPTCGEQHEDQFDSCWKCVGLASPTSTDAVDDPEIPEVRLGDSEEQTALFCERCGVPMESFGHDVLQGGTGLFGSFFPPAKRAWKCPLCERVEHHEP